MYIHEVRDEFETSIHPIASFVGSVIGPLIVLGAFTALGLFIARWHPWGAVAFAIIALIAAAYTLIEIVWLAVEYRKSITVSTVGATLYALAITAIHCALFVGAGVILLSGHI
jgi:hypothetical protein